MNKWLFLSLLCTTSLIFSDQTSVNHALEWAKGHQLFQDIKFKLHEKEFIRLAKEGQTPRALFVGCSDSRVLPELLTHSKPGQLFVVRNAGNFVPRWNPSEKDGVAASIVYAIEVLNVKEIIVCGHSECGAIQGLFKMDELEKIPYINNWIQLGESAKKAALSGPDATVNKDDLYEITARLSVVFQLQHLMTYPAIKKRVEDGTIFLHGWYFQIRNGTIEYYDPAKEEFLSLQDLLVN